MFVYRFASLGSYIYNKLTKAPQLLYSISLVGPMLTLYSENEYAGILANKGYSILLPFQIEHQFAHDANIFHSIYPSSLRDHTHVVLPCKKDILSELRELLDLIASHNTHENRLIHEWLIEDCLNAYKNYWRTISLDACKKNTNILLMRWVAPYLQFQHSMPASQTTAVSPPNSDNLALSMIELFASKNLDAYDSLRRAAISYFDTLASYPLDKKQHFNDLVDLMPLTNAWALNRDVKLNPITTAAFIFLGLIMLALLIHAFVDEDLVVPSFILLACYAPKLFQGIYALVQTYNPLKTPDPAEIKLDKLAIRYGKQPFFAQANSKISFVPDPDEFSQNLKG